MPVRRNFSDAGGGQNPPSSGAGGEAQSEKHPLGNIPDSVRLLLTQFTCTVCDTRNQHQFSRVSYQKGVVIVKCPGCEGHHLMADNLGWFRDENVNIESLMKEKNEVVLTDDG